MAEKDLNLTKLDGKNFQMWKFGVTFLLESQGLTEFVDGTTVEPDATRHPEEFKKWKKNSSKTAVHLLTSVEQSLHVNLINCSTPKAIWDKLHSLYSDSSEDAKQSAWQQFYEFKIKEGECIVTQIEVFEAICKKLESANEKLSEASIMSKILNSLPSRFSTFTMAWECTSKDERKKENLIARILKEEKRLTGSDSVEDSQMALQINAIKIDPDKKKMKGKKIEDLKKRTKCNYCKEKGHWARECKKRIDDIKKRTNSAENSASTYMCDIDDLKDAVSTTDVSSFYSDASLDNDEAWIADSGASMHMTGHREYFSKLEPFCEVRHVKIADNKVLPTAGVGNIDIEVNINNELFCRQLSNVLYVPSLKKNLFSVGAANDKGFSFHCYKDHCVIKDRNNSISAVGKRYGSLFQMQFKVKVPECNIAQTASLELWHKRLGHINLQTIKKTQKLGAVDGLKVQDKTDFFCETCVLAKQTSKPHVSRNQQKLFKAGEMIHSDVCGPTNIASPSGSNYFLIFKDELSGFSTLYFLKRKSEVIDKFKEFEALVARQTSNRIKVLRTDNGTEYTSHEFRKFLQCKGIVHETSSPYLHEQNGCVERELRTLVNCARSMLIANDVPQYLWTEAVKTASYVVNRTVSTRSDGITPYEAWFGRKPEIDHLRVFGSEAFLHLPKEKHTSKFSARSKKLIMVGYDGESKNYRLYDSSTKRIHVSSDVIFNENANGFDKKVNSPVNTFSLRFENMCEFETEKEDDEDEQQIRQVETLPDNEDTDFIASENERDAPRLRDRDLLRKPAYLENYALLTESVPLTYDIAVSCPEAKYWSEAMKEEMSALQKNSTWTLVDLPKGRHPIGNKWVYTLKTDKDGNITKYKARLVAKGFTQREGIDYSDTFAPVVRYESIRVLLALAAKNDLEMAKFDVKTAFLNGDIEEDLYMIQPQGFVSEEHPDLVCRLKRSLYGLKQSPRCWNSKFVNFLRSFNFEPIQSDNCVFIGNDDQEKVYLGLYVDDGLLLSKSQKAIDKVLENLQSKFEVTVENTGHFVGMEIERNRQKKQVTISQTAYINKILKKFHMEEAKNSAIPAEPGLHLSGNKKATTDEFQDKVNQIPYREAVGSLLFLARVSRPDIEYAVNRASQFLTNFSEEHWQAVKRIFRYLCGTKNFGITYGSSGSEGNLTGFTDADYAGCLDTRRSTSGFVFMFHGGPVTWSSQRQGVVSLSTTEAEYIALAHGVKESIWLKNMFCQLGVTINCVSIFVDNQSAIKLANNPEFHKRTKHIEVRYHFTREVFERGDIDLIYINSKDQLADLFTKPLGKLQHHYLREKMNIHATGTK